MGRFVSADALISTKKAGLGSNVFTYCFNNPSNYFDSCGTDAIWIQERDSAGGQGHTGLMVQDDTGKWFYFFWGPPSESEDDPDIISLCIGVENGAYYVSCSGDISNVNLQSTDAVINTVHQISDSNGIKDRSDKITDTVYLEGDYSKTHEYLNALCGMGVDCTEQYNLVLNNCVQKSLYALFLSDSRFAPFNKVMMTDSNTVTMPSVFPNYEFYNIPLRLMG